LISLSERRYSSIPISPYEKMLLISMALKTQRDFPKIGPKTALQILMQADVTTLQKAILSQDPLYLTKTSGIGKKTAEKIVMELKEYFDGSEFTAPVSEDMDVMDALLALGYGHKEVRDALAKLPVTTTDTRKRITEALRMLTS
jgi:holliday junction DNA helicase RuvA